MISQANVDLNFRQIRQYISILGKQFAQDEGGKLNAVCSSFVDYSGLLLVSELVSTNILNAVTVFWLKYNMSCCIVS